MVGGSDLHTETESEDGGVSLPILESSDENGGEHDSAPTTASQSPTCSVSNPINVEGLLPFTGGGATPEDSLHPPNPLGSPTDDSTPFPIFWDPEASTGPDPSSSLELHDDLPVPSWMPEHAFADTTWPSPTIADLDQEDPASSALYSFTPLTHPPNNQPLEGQEFHFVELPPDLQQNVQQPHHPHHPLPLPTLTEVFGSEFLTQTLGSPQNLGPFQNSIFDDEDFVEVDEDYSEQWDDENSPRNYDCDAFFNFWKMKYAYSVPGYPKISELARRIQGDKTRKKVIAEDIDPKNPESPDLQGIYWSRFQTTKEEAREVRRMTYTNHINDTDQHEYTSSGLRSNVGAFGTKTYKMKFFERLIPSFDRHFDFRETNLKVETYISHFQLRHSLCANSKNAIFYARRPKLGYDYGAYIQPGNMIKAQINCFNPSTSGDDSVMEFSFRKRLDNQDSPGAFRPSTLNAANGVLMVGSFEGKYAMKSLSSDYDNKFLVGNITESTQGNSSTNHIQNYLDRRSGLPQVAFSSNDLTVRIMDCTTQKFTNVHYFTYPVNSSAISPDGRLRLLVGDDCLPIVANAETGQEITKLHGHTNFGFACDWAPDGVTMATGHQDGFVHVWDARNMSRSMQVIPMEMAGSRTLQFSPLGSGKRVLIIAEPADFVHVVDAQTFESKQVIEFFGEIAGISMPPDGEALYIANQDRTFGGLMEFERSYGGRSGGMDFQRKESKEHNWKDGYDPDALIKDIEDINGFLDGTSKQPDRKSKGKDVKRKNPKRKDPIEDEIQAKLREPRSFDWLPDDEMDEHPLCVTTKAQRERRGTGLHRLMV
ncbi:hypothetical protein ACLMJK_006996 [Lecanora helva]